MHELQRFWRTPALVSAGPFAGILILVFLFVPCGSRAECIDYATHPWSIPGIDTPGTAYDVALGDGFACIADDGGLRVVDLSDPTAPVLAGYLAATNSYQVAVSGHLAFVGGPTSYLKIVDVDNPADPHLLSSISVTSTLGVAASGNLVFVARPNGLRIIDVSNPSAPQVVGATSTPVNPTDVAVSGTTVCLALGIWGIQVIEVSDPANPQLVGNLFTPEPAQSVAFQGQMAIVGDDVGVEVVDISDHTHPILRGVLGLRGISRAVALTGSRALVANEGLSVVDVSNPSAPVLVSQVPTLSPASSVATDGAFGYVAARTSGLRVVPLDPLPDVPSGVELPGSPADVALSGAFAYVATSFDGVSDGGLQVLDLSDPSAPSLAGSLSLPVSSGHLAVSGGFAYLTSIGDFSDGMPIVSVYDPFHPYLMATLVLPYDPHIDLAVSGTHAYVVLGEHGLRIYDLTYPTSPVLVGSYETPDYTVGVHVSGIYAYVVNTSTGLQIIDVQNPAAPQLAGSIDPPGSASSVVVKDGLACLTSSVGLQLVDVTNPAAPQLRGTAAVGSCTAVSVDNSYAYVSTGQGLFVVEVGNPSAPIIVGGANLLAGPRGSAESGEALYLADASGFLALPVQCPGTGVTELPVPAGPLDGLRVLPNPSAGAASIGFRLGAAGTVQLSILDAGGRCLRRLAPLRLDPGTHSVLWDGADESGRTTPAGIYLVRIETPQGFAVTRVARVR